MVSLPSNVCDLNHAKLMQIRNSAISRAIDNGGGKLPQIASKIIKKSPSRQGQLYIDAMVVST